MKITTDDTEDDPGALINLTPLLDVVFNLIIFFMVTTQFLEDERDLKIELPDAENAGKAAALPQNLLVNVRQDGKFLVGDRVLDRDELKKLLQEAKRARQDQHVTLRVDRETPFRHPVVVFDLCKGLAIETSLAVVGPDQGK
jgi:biopolymer transport protein ExbD